MFTENGYGRLWETASCKERIFAFLYIEEFFMQVFQFDATNGDYFALNPAITYGDDDIRQAYNVYPFEMDGESRNLMGKYNKWNKESKSFTSDRRIYHRSAKDYFIA